MELTRLQPDELLPSVPMAEHVPTTRTTSGVVIAPLPPTPEPDEIIPTWLPPAPAWYRGRREQWQIAKLNLERAYLDVDTTARADAAVHEATPAPRVYVLAGAQRYQEADTICGCWRCRGTSTGTRSPDCWRSKQRSPAAGSGERNALCKAVGFSIASASALI